jgi:pimeloyl-ACP methyl ester carboxylesterase
MRDHWITADGLMIHAVTWEPSPRGFGVARPESSRSSDAKQPDPLLLVHGLGANTVTWEPVAQQLADATGARVTAIDLPGFGRTPVGEGGATVGRAGRLVSAVLEQRGPAVVFGNSMGGSIAVGVAARRPDLVRKLVLVDPAVPRVASIRDSWVVTMRFSPMLVEWLGRLVIAARLRALGPEGLVDANLDWSVSDTSRVDPELRNKLIALADERNNQPETVIAYSNAARSLIRYLWHTMAADIAEVRCPTLVVQGALDRLVPLSSITALGERRPDFTIEVLDDTGHAPQIETPDRFLAVVVPWLHRLASRNRNSSGFATPNSSAIAPAAGGG